MQLEVHLKKLHELESLAAKFVDTPVAAGSS